VNLEISRRKGVQNHAGLQALQGRWTYDAAESVWVDALVSRGTRAMLTVLYQLALIFKPD